jgi:nicotinate-nucleotide--dimethylbenzimidazole phosphoribosyltransferase
MAESLGDETLLRRTLAAVQPADPEAAAAAQTALDAKTKPRGSLGRLEALACRVAAIRATSVPGRLAPAIVVIAADHGIAAERVSAYPQEVTGQMLATIAAGGAAVSVLSRQAGARLVVLDVGVRGASSHPGVVDRRIRSGTANAARGPAMSRAEAERALAIGIRLAAELVSHGIGLVALGDMGIANTTAASALTATLLGVDASLVCGRGTGIDDAGLERKVDAVRRALAVNAHALDDPLEALAAVGGLELAALAGLALGCAAHRVPVVIDGFITSAAALAAVRLAPPCADALIAAHRSPEPGHRLILEAIGLEPLLDLGLRLGEGSGAALALPLVGAALAVLSDMATFDAAGVTDTGA